MNCNSKPCNYSLLSLTLLIIFVMFSFLHAQSPLDPNAKLETIATGIQQPEGPVWKEGIGLLFSDIAGNKIYQWTGQGEKKVFLTPSDNTNGLTFDAQGRLIAGQMGLRRIVRFEPDGTQTELASKYNGKKFNCPNDLVVKSDGSIFFTDPDFNIPQGQHSELGFQGIYRISPSGEVQLLDGSFDKPNGICFSPDEKKLYVNESPKCEIYVWDVVDDSTITNKRLFTKLPVSGYSDGMKVDPDGNIYCTGPTGVWVYSPDGPYLGKIALPNNASASNCAWGEADGKTLFITAGYSGTSVFRIRPLLTDVKNEQGSVLPESFELFQNYPNPFNPETVISYRLSANSYVTLKIFDFLGREVSTPVNNEQLAGKYEVTFNGQRTTRSAESGARRADNIPLSTGIYFYTLSVGEHSRSSESQETKKMLLLK